MARTTVEDCLRICPNHFELTMRAAKRARRLEMSGDTPHVDREDDKSVVVALREIREGRHFEEEPEGEPAEAQEAPESGPDDEDTPPQKDAAQPG